MPAHQVQSKHMHGHLSPLNLQAAAQEERQRRMDTGPPHPWEGQECFWEAEALPPA